MPVVGTTVAEMRTEIKRRRLYVQPKRDLKRVLSAGDQPSKTERLRKKTPIPSDFNAIKLEDNIACLPLSPTPCRSTAALMTS